MWTPKRILILMSGLLLSAIIYATQALIFGGSSELPPLPTPYLPDSGGIPCGLPVPTCNDADRLCEKVFGTGCEELRRPYRLWLPNRGLLLALNSFAIEPDGRVRLARCSTAIFHDTLPGAEPEITVIRCDVALLTLDRPATAPRDLTDRKVVRIELQGKTPGVHIVHNRGSADKSDVVDLLVLNAPLWYEGEGHRLWSNGIVRLTDFQTKPPMTISGMGLDMNFIAENSMLNRLDRLTIRQDVDMHVWVDPQIDFLNVPQQNADAAATLAHMHIRTPGMFVYDFSKDSVCFEGPAVQPSAKEPNCPNQVHVQRSQNANGKGNIDQLICDRLDVQFRSTSLSSANAQSGGFDKEIETVKAIARSPNEVVVALESEGLAAYGQSLYYHSENSVHPPQTIFKGEPLVWCKGRYKINCRELHLVGSEVVQIVK